MTLQMIYGLLIQIVFCHLHQHSLNNLLKHQLRIKSTELAMARDAFEVTALLIKSENRNKPRSEVKSLRRENYLTMPEREILQKNKEINDINNFQEGKKKSKK